MHARNCNGHARHAALFREVVSCTEAAPPGADDNHALGGGDGYKVSYDEKRDRPLHPGSHRARFAVEKLLQVASQLATTATSVMAGPLAGS